MFNLINHKQQGNKMDIKAAIAFLKAEIKKISSEQRKDKYAYRAAQRAASKLLFQNGQNPYHWTWTITDPETKKVSYYWGGSKDAVLQKNFKETDEAYKIRNDLWLEYLKTSGYTRLPGWFYGEDEEITCMHVLCNKLREAKPHTEKDEKYVDSETYKALLQRIEMQFPLLEASQGDDNAAQ
jgi:hypothetical protein